MKTRGMVTPAARAAATWSMARSVVTPLRSACRPDRWMVGPSASGSLKGMPISMAAQPATWAARRLGTVSSRCGKPAVTYGTSWGSPPTPGARSAALSRSPSAIGVPVCLGLVLAHGADVLVAAPRQADDHDVVGVEGVGQLLGRVHRVARLQRRDDALETAETVECAERVGVGGGDVPDAPAVAQGAVLGSDAGVVEAGADRVRGEHLAVLILHEVAVRTVQHAGTAAVQRRRMFLGVEAAPGRLDTDQAHVAVVEEGGEHADRVAAPADAGDDRGGQTAEAGQHLGAGLVTDHPLEAAHQRGVRVGADAAADDVVGVAHRGHPVADGLVGRVLGGARAAVDGPHLGAEQAHAVDVEGLAAHVLTAHVHRAAEPEMGAGGGGGDTVLAGAGLGDDPQLAHAPGKEHLAEGVVDLVGAGVEQVLALE